jgi:uncharacterized protein (DUF2267 family)
MTQVTALANAWHKSQQWLAEICDELGWTDSQHAYVALRATLHALRDRLTVDEAADLAAQLPLVVRGIYFEGWNPSSTPARIRDLDTFLLPVRRALVWDFVPDPERVARAVFVVLSRHVSRGEIEDVLGSLPAEIRGLFPGEVVEAWSERYAESTAGVP